MILTNFIYSVSSHSTACFFVTFQLDRLEVVKLSLVEVGQVPEDADVFKTKIVPFIGIRVVRHFVIMHILALPPSSGKSD